MPLRFPVIRLFFVSIMSLGKFILMELLILDIHALLSDLIYLFSSWYQKMYFVNL